MKMFQNLVIAYNSKFGVKVLTCQSDNTGLQRHMLPNISPINSPSSDVAPVQLAVSMQS